jgi:aerobic carbon-monoxide dehydrogenase medium subunit
MKPFPFEYFSPENLSAAIELKNQYGDQALALAGGQSLVAALNFRCLTPAVLIDLNTVPELAYIHSGSQGEILIGPMTRTRALEFDPLIEEQVPLVHAAVPYIAHPAIRNRGTIGGSISYADPAGEFPAVTMAVGAEYRLASLHGSRWVKAEEFFTALFHNCMSPDELLVEIRLPPQPANMKWGYQEISRRQGDRVMMGVAASLEIDQQGTCRSARLVYLNAAPVPFLATQTAALLRGEKWSLELVETAANSAAQEIDPAGDVHATIAFQRHLAAELTRRVLAQAYQISEGAA